jgi:hypothetical protein
MTQSPLSRLQQFPSVDQLEAHQEVFEGIRRTFHRLGDHKGQRAMEFALEQIRLVRSETRERWNYGKPPKDEKDCRRLVSIEQDGVQWIGIRAWNHERQCWMDGSGNAPELASVVAWRWLPDPAWLQNSGSGCEKEDYRL